VEKEWAKNVYWMFGVVLPKNSSVKARTFSQDLKELGIETRPFFLGMHEQPVFQKMGLFHGEKYPVSEHLSQNGFYLPSGLKITESQIDQVCDAVQKVLKSKSI